jgi:hypothetical protein
MCFFFFDSSLCSGYGFVCYFHCGYEAGQSPQLACAVCLRGICSAKKLGFLVLSFSDFFLPRFLVIFHLSALLVCFLCVIVGGWRVFCVWSVGVTNICVLVFVIFFLFTYTFESDVSFLLFRSLPFSFSFSFVFWSFFC